MHSFKEIRFPDSLLVGAIGGAEYSTDIVTSVSGKEIRNINNLIPRYNYSLSLKSKTYKEICEIIDFFNNVKGKGIGFRFKDFLNYKADDELIGVGDGVNTVFQLSKKIGDHRKKISKPVLDSIRIFVDNQLKEISVDSTQGKIEFSKAPPKLSKITASFEFDIPVRFDNDQCDIEIEAADCYSWNNVKFVEINL